MINQLLEKCDIDINLGTSAFKTLLIDNEKEYAKIKKHYLDLYQIKDNFIVKGFHLRGGPSWIAEFKPRHNAADLELVEAIIYINCIKGIRRGEIIGEKGYFVINNDKKEYHHVFKEWKHPYSVRMKNP